MTNDSWDNDHRDTNLATAFSAILAARLRILAFATLSAGAVFCISFFFIEKTYKSEVVLMVINNTQPLGGLSSLLPASGLLGFGGRGSNELETILNSPNFKRQIIEKHDLLPLLYKSKWDAELKKWDLDEDETPPSATRALEENKLTAIYGVVYEEFTNLLRITWVSNDPRHAERMLSNIVSDLHDYVTNDYETSSQQERIFVEKQLAAATRNLVEWESKVPSEQHPIPEIQREIAAATAIYTELRKQLELAKVNEAKDILRFKVVGAPYVPAIKAGPMTALNTLVAFFLGSFLAMCVAVAIRFRRLSASSR